jgi:kumamolisin
MRRLFTAVLPLAAAAALGTFGASAASSEFAVRGGHVEIPASSIEQPEHIGVTAHTNFKMFFPNAGGMANASPLPMSRQAKPQIGPPYAGYFFETPASLGCVYKLVSPVVAGCNPNTVVANPAGGARAIAIVDAYHYPTAMSDLAVFSAQFGLPAPSNANFQVVYASGRQPPGNPDWNIEEALDIEWAHAMAPSAKIYLVEAASSSFNNLLTAVSVANSLLKSAGGGEVSISWGGSEFSAETSYDPYFTQPGVVYFAASGDSPGVIWPSTSPNVVSVGGTSLSRNAITGDFQQELAWQSGGGGPSVYEPRPGYQNAISAIVQSRRGTPDVAADADPTTGAWVYSYPYWYVVGGTSLAAPVWAGIANAAGKFYSSTQTELTTLYANSSNAANFTDVVQGSCGPNQGYLTAAGWDFCSGVGSPVGIGEK